MRTPYEYDQDGLRTLGLQQEMRRRDLATGVRRNNGDYTHFLHMFALIDSKSTEDKLATVGGQYVYPWPFTRDTKIDIEHLNCLYKLGAFEHFPQAWQSFWGEVEMMADTNDFFGAGQRGPYLMLFPSHARHLVPEMVVGLKRKARDIAMRTRHLYMSPMEFVDNYVMKSLAPYLVHINQEMANANNGSG